MESSNCYGMAGITHEEQILLGDDFTSFPGEISEATPVTSRFQSKFHANSDCDSFFLHSYGAISF
jgi:hypothetical protein